MAINDHIRGLEVQVVLMDQTVLDEHEDSHEKPYNEKTTTIRYIEATTDFQFLVRVDYGPDFKYKRSCIKENLYIDGKRLYEKKVHSDDFQDGRSVDFQKANVAPYKGASFFFAPINIGMSCAHAVSRRFALTGTS